MTYSNLVEAKAENKKTFEVYRNTNVFMELRRKPASELSTEESKAVQLKHLAGISIDAAIELWREHNQYFDIAAKVEAIDNEELFMLTNSIDRFWGENEQVELISNNTFNSSTSIGDVIKVDGKTFICACAGWQEIS